MVMMPIVLVAVIPVVIFVMVMSVIPLGFILAHFGLPLIFEILLERQGGF